MVHFLCLLVAIAFQGAVLGFDVWDHADQLIEEYTVKSERAIQVALADFQALSLQTSSVSGNATEVSEDAIETIKNKLETEIANIRSAANDSTATTIEQCIGQYSSEIDHLPVYVEELITVCIHNLEDKIAAEIESAIAQIVAYRELRVTFRLELDSCRVATIPDDCATFLVIEILIQTIEVPLNIQEITRRSTDIIRNYLNQVGYCTINRLEGATTMVDTIVRHIKTCASLS